MAKEYSVDYQLFILKNNQKKSKNEKQILKNNNVFAISTP
tara:strand:- start:941 stop:1060 length:120 start_codon:yes stop_codon:yes gene_type:complete